MEKQLTCDERIAEHMESREADFKALFAKANSDDDLQHEEALDELSEAPLAITAYKLVRIDLSTGGPGDWLEVTLDDEGFALNVEYHFNDWFDHAARPVEKGSWLWEAALHYAEYAQ